MKIRVLNVLLMIFLIGIFFILSCVSFFIYFGY